MANKMLIDATHGEETRVVVVRGHKVEEFDFESSQRKQLRGNIYLAKVTRVEPSLQAAFVEYGGNRHGFLAFSEIHPDYYQIPVADRQALLDEEQFSSENDEFEEEREQRSRRRSPRWNQRPAPSRNPSDAAIASEDIIRNNDDPDHGAEAEHQHDSEEGHSDETIDNSFVEQIDAGSSYPSDEAEGDERGEEIIESVGSGEALEDMPRRLPRRTRQYKIQEVIKRRQIILIQVVKEERGNKGAALTTYLSLAGRYSVLMPNTARGGGISRKITSVQDRTRLKEIVEELEVPDGMGVILRTAGATRTKLEVKRDFEYLLRLWETVRETTLGSSAPTLVYEEGNLVKRAIRDLYNKDIDEVIVSGEQGHREAKDFMRMLMPSHARNVQLYRESVPIFARFGVESQLDAMFSNEVTLRSGGYIVINQTEALVAIDVNSGRSTREHNIEDTALKTNLEAAEEIARQLRLRDLAGLIVCDFIDMEEKRNNRSVEKRMKDCLKHDRARIQVGHISHFGLMEMSRQRIRTGVLESSTEKCALCSGTGMVRSVPSVALNVLRTVEDYLLRNPGFHLIVRTHTAVALYVLNQKRQHVLEIEKRFGASLLFSADETLPPSEFLAIQKGEAANPEDVQRAASVRMESVAALPEPEDADDLLALDEGEEAIEGNIDPNSDEKISEEEGARRRRRRRKRRGGRGTGQSFESEADDNEQSDASEQGVENSSEAHSSDDASGDAGELASEASEPRRPRRRRGRAGGRNGSRPFDEDRERAAPHQDTGVSEPGANIAAENGPAASVEDISLAPDEEKRPRRRAPRRRLPEIAQDTSSTTEGSAPVPATEERPLRARAPRRPRQQETRVETSADKKPKAEFVSEAVSVASGSVQSFTPTVAPEPAHAASAEDQRPRRSGWWQRKIFGGD
jgi:ribonuclease E